MSLLADLLSKVKYPQSKREIPPNLKDIVSTSARESAHKRRMIFISIFFAIAVISGILTVYFTRSFTGVSYKDNLKGIKQKSADDSQELVVSRRGTTSTLVETQQPNSSVGSSTVTSQQALDKPERPEEIKEAKDLKPTTSIETVKTDNAVSRGETQSIEKIIKTEKAQPVVDPDERKATEHKISSEIDAYLYSARNHELKEDYSKALSDYRKILELDKNNYYVMNNIAYILLQIGLIKESIEYSWMAIRTKKDYVPALTNLAIAYARLGDASAAERYLNRANMIEPTNKSVILNLAILLEKQGDYKGSSEYFLRLVRLGDVKGSLGLARTYEKQGKIEEALKIYRDIYSLNSIDNETRQMIEQRLNPACLPTGC